MATLKDEARNITYEVPEDVVCIASGFEGEGCIYGECELDCSCKPILLARN